METMMMIGKIVLCVLSVIIVALVVMQKPKGEGVSGAALGQSGGASSSSKYKSRSLDDKLSFYTKITAGLFAVISLALILIQ